MRAPGSSGSDDDHRARSAGASSQATAPWLLAVFALTACHDSFVRGRDGGRTPDGAVPERDATVDASLDGAAGTRDGAGPSIDAGRCDPVEMVLEERWPFSPVEHPDRVHVTSTPLVLPPSRPGGAARLAFVSHGPILDANGARNDEGPVVAGRMAVELGGVLRVVDLETRETLTWADPPGFSTLAPTSTLAAGDLDGDGELELVALGAYGHMHAFELGLQPLWHSRTPPFPPPIGPLRPLLSVSGAPLVADLEGDGSVEVVFGNCVVEGATGERRFCIPDEALSASQGYWGPISTLADLDGDGRLDVLAGRIAVSPEGAVHWRLDDELYGFSGFGEVSASHPGPEVVLVRRSNVYLLEPSTGTVLESYALPSTRSTMVFECPRPKDGGWPEPMSLFAGGPPLLLDVDGDGDREIAVAHDLQLVLLDPSCEGCVLRWTHPIRDELSATTGVSAADLDGDGAIELLHADATTLRIIDALTGELRASVRRSSRTRTEYPVIADVDRDDSAEIIVGSSSEDCYTVHNAPLTPPGIVIYGERHGRWVDVATQWTQHIGTLETGRRQPTLGPGAPFEAGCM